MRMCDRCGKEKAVEILEKFALCKDCYYKAELELGYITEEEYKLRRKRNLNTRLILGCGIIALGITIMLLGAIFL